ncbi:MAG: hypothetical protein JWR35_2359 [Marmoricola sp.]|nr:hypothetical protein [Marmoricola sp.]
MIELAGLSRREKPLAVAQAEDGTWLVGTSVALVLVNSPSVEPLGTPRRIPWEQVEAADWDKDSSRIRVAEVGTYGEARPAYSFEVGEPGPLLELMRERVTASVVLQRWVPVAGKRGVRVIARRPPGGGMISWMHEYDPGVDPSDPAVAALADEALRVARSDVGQD